MLRKLAIAAVGVVALFLVAVIVSMATGWGSGDAGPPTLDASQLPERFQGGPVTEDDDLTSVGQGTGGWIQRTDPETGRLVQEFRYGSLEPRREGEFDVTDPQARLYVGRSRVVTMRAERGVIVAPGNIPQQGSFRDNVLITIYEAPRGEAVDLSAGSPHLAVTIELDDATFDTRLGKIDSAGRVTVNARQAEFRGRGLTLVYNEPRQRIEFLEVIEGESLTYVPPAAQDEATDRGPRRPVGPQAGAAEPDAEPADPGDIQYYQVVFERDIEVTSDGGTIEAQTLTGLFSFNRRDRVREASGGASGLPRGALASASPAAVASAATQPAPTDSPERVTMTWNGSMTVTPRPTKPAALADDGDVLLTFTGAPVRAVSPDGDVLTAGHLEYHESWGQVGALGSAAHPLRIDSPALGVIRADDLTLKIDTGVGALWGAGSIVAHPAEDGEAPRGLPEGFSIAWTDRVELNLAGDDEPDGLKNANFVGDVKVIDPRFTMAGRQLNVRFEPTAEGDDRRFAGVDASGDVVATSADGSIRAQQLELTTVERPDGEIVPTTLVAAGEVSVTDKTQTINAGRLNVTFNETPIKGDQSRIDIATVRAGDGVTVAMEDGTKVTATTLNADNAAGTAVMTGEPVTIVQDDSEIRVARLRLERDGQVAHATGKGEFVMIEPATAGRPDGRRVQVRWTESMHYTEAGDRLDVAGGVVVEQSDKPTELNRLAAERLRIDLHDREQLAEAGVDEESMLKKLTATDNVVVLATKWASPRRDTVETRLRISGPTLTFTDATEQVEVIGPGSMLIEDYRDAGNDEQLGAVTVSGKGATLFTWTGGMTLDGARTDVILSGAVNMTHKPADRDATLEMQAGRLVADMRGIGGLEVIDMSNVESMEVNSIEATGQVQVRDATRLITSHRLYYDGAEQTVLLEARPGRKVTIVKIDEPKPIRAGKVTWDLTRDRVEVDEVGY